MNRVKVAIIGLGFGEDFIPIYQDHPDAEVYAICRRNEEKLKACGEKFGIKNLFTDYRDILKIDEIDAVHVVTPLGTHAHLTLDALNAGKHVASTIPMAQTVEDCTEIVKTRRKVNRIYMFMETAAYTREFIYVKNLVDSGKLGKIQFLRGAHQQNMEEWAEPWPGFPPMQYSTHALSPCVLLAKADVESVVCFGSGRIRKDYTKFYNSPFAIETALVKFKNSDLACEVTRSLYDTIRQYIESFCVYGMKLAFEWNQLANEEPVVFSSLEDAERVEIPDTGYLLPKEIDKYTRTAEVMDENQKAHLSFVQGAGHGGSHPHLVHEFIRAIAEGRDAAIDAEVGAMITATGILAHRSAMRSGERMMIPDFRNL